ncbi:hypothetical protein BDB00DRAFT_782998 [Zychaea mexicana]|uniref:uncharacterized protein n=1 Tax=Zychaea mexicana TaxID=64656 RepID=UPI0022FE3422|nr:uncharacterized protein BDB00DRAFT_782998 [Zychaea mexicana]KAI9499491.1 hypothetical protein BDB00DRAFT_782998 [Zychaea mexicana]
MSSTAATHNIVIVGGGYAGVRLAQALEKRFSGNDEYRVLLIDKKSYFYHIIAGPRAAVEHINNVIPYTHTFKDQEKNLVVQAMVVRLEKDKLYLDKRFEGSTELQFAYTVLATVKEAHSILIIGGGPTGVEVAGEILEKYSDKKIILAHDQKQLLNDDIPAWSRTQMLHKVKKNNVEVLLDDPVILPAATSIEQTIYKPEEPLTTRKGTRLQVDLVMLMFGMRAETGWLEDTLPLASNGGFIKVKPTLQVDAPGFDNVYAAGDVADIDEYKLAGRSMGHTRVICANIMNSTKGKEPSRTYKANNKFLMGITFGKVCFNSLSANV